MAFCSNKWHFALPQLQSQRLDYLIDLPAQLRVHLRERSHRFRPRLLILEAQHDQILFRKPRAVHLRHGAEALGLEVLEHIFRSDPDQPAHEIGMALQKVRQLTASGNKARTVLRFAVSECAVCARSLCRPNTGPTGPSLRQN